MKKKDILTALLLLGSTVQAQNWPEIKKHDREADGGGWEVQSIKRDLHTIFTNTVQPE